MRAYNGIVMSRNTIPTPEDRNDSLGSNNPMKTTMNIVG